MTTLPADQQALMVFCTVPDESVALQLAEMLVGARLAACVNLVPGLRSIYRWRGKIEDDAELLLLIKTTPDRFAELRQRLVETHPYEVPEVIALPLVDGHPPYLRWVNEMTRPA